jgi:hypothetical protein
VNNHDNITKDDSLHCEFSTHKFPGWSRRNAGWVSLALIINEIIRVWWKIVLFYCVVTITRTKAIFIFKSALLKQNVRIYSQISQPILSTEYLPRCIRVLGKLIHSNVATGQWMCWSKKNMAHVPQAIWFWSWAAWDKYVHRLLLLLRADGTEKDQEYLLNNFVWIATKCDELLTLLLVSHRSPETSDSNRRLVS